MKCKTTGTNFFEETFLLFENDLSYLDDEDQTELDFLLRGSFEELQDVLSMIFVDDRIFSQPAVIHGMITPATVLPDIDSEKGKFVDAWIVCVHSQFKSERFTKVLGGTFTKFTEVEPAYIADKVEDILTSNICDESDMFILYGKEVNISYALDEEELSDNVLSSCEKICEVAEKLLTKG